MFGLLFAGILHVMQNSSLYKQYTLGEHLLTWFFWSALSLNSIHRTNLSFQSESGTEQLVDEDVAENKNQYNYQGCDW